MKRVLPLLTVDQEKYVLEKHQEETIHTMAKKVKASYYEVWRYCRSNNVSTVSAKSGKTVGETKPGFFSWDDFRTSTI